MEPRLPYLVLLFHQTQATPEVFLCLMEVLLILHSVYLLLEELVELMDHQDHLDHPPEECPVSRRPAGSVRMRHRDSRWGMNSDTSAVPRGPLPGESTKA